MGTQTTANLISASLGSANEFEFQVDTFQNLGSSNPDDVKRTLKMNGLRTALFPLIPSNFTYWIFVPRCVAMVRRHKNKPLSKRRVERMRRDAGLDGNIGPRSWSGISSRSDWFEKNHFSKDQDGPNAIANHIVQCWSHCNTLNKVANLLSSDDEIFKKALKLNQWGLSVKKTLGPSAKDFLGAVSRAKRFVTDRTNPVDLAIKRILTAKDRRAAANRELVKACGIYAFLRTVYGADDFTAERTELEATSPRDIKAYRMETKEWANVLLEAFQKHPVPLAEVRHFEREIRKSRSKGDPIWNDVWAKTDGRKKLLISFKFQQF